MVVYKLIILRVKEVILSGCYKLLYSFLIIMWANKTQKETYNWSAHKSSIDLVTNMRENQFIENICLRQKKSKGECSKYISSSLSISLTLVLLQNFETFRIKIWFHSALYKPFFLTKRWTKNALVIFKTKQNFVNLINYNTEMHSCVRSTMFMSV